MKRKAGILVAVYAAVFAINLDTTIVNVALPSIARELDAATRDLQWVVDGYNLAFAALVLAAGSLSDRYGRRPALLVGLVGFAVAPPWSAAWSPARRAHRRAGGDGRLRGADLPRHAVADLQRVPRPSASAPPRSAAGAPSSGVGVALGPVVGGLLLDHFSWGSVFLALAPLALVAVLAGVPRPRVAGPAAPPLDRRGLVVSVAMLGLLVWTIIEAPDPGLGVGRDHRRLRRQRRTARPRSSSSSAAPRTRCSTSPCSPTGGSAPRAAR